MNIKIIAVGKIKENYVKAATDEYIKRLSPFCNLSVEEIPAEQINDENLYEKYKKTEGEKILSKIKNDSIVITLEILGKTLSSEEFAEKLKEITSQGVNEICFVIGGANGLHSDVSKRADFKLSFSKMTFTHQLIRILLTEQIYRAAKFNANEKYHR